MMISVTNINGTVITKAIGSDVAILALPIRGHEFEILPLLTERLFVALPPKHTLAGRRALSLKDLRAEPFLLLRDGQFAARHLRINRDTQPGEEFRSAAPLAAQTSASSGSRSPLTSLTITAPAAIAAAATAGL